eukprot:CAMPEP_0172072978 /NCGR_PEP_ID=MMETSP1043-20130122/14598_1 /TAXON_ID=464988 /ORGANISM="Hemiselmis andersenii, Strain CCMP441" /LENGTH=43 /DNA_ID= /DNA_START= /DNA_END= /DNA_ORIENTATION=
MTVWSQLPEASSEPSWFHATEVTHPECPLRVPFSWPSGVQRRT